MKDKNKNFKFLEHTGDIKFQAFGKTIEELFQNCAITMIYSQYKGQIKTKITKKIKVNGQDNESLLYNFLEEILFLIDSECFLTSKAKVKIKGNELTAELTGDNIKNYKMSFDIKAVTYNEMFVKNNEKEWVAQVVIDV